MKRAQNRGGLRRIAGLLSLLLVAGGLGLGGGAAAATGSATVTIGTSLSPRAIVVAPGTTVTWRNADGAEHRIRTTSGPVELDSGNLQPGDAWSFTFTARGTYTYLDDRNADNSAYFGTVTVGAAPATGGSGAPAPPAPAVAAVHLAGEAFTPASVTVAIGGVVTWTNNDTTAHTVTSDSGAFDSKILAPGQVFTFRFTTAGTYRYTCVLHSNMSGTVAVPTATGTVPPPVPAAPKPVRVSTPAAPLAPNVAPAPGRPGRHTVVISDAGFSPANLSARAGDTVTWVNQGAMPHTATAAGGAFDLMINPGGSSSTVLRTPGTTHYVCSFHSFMTGSIVVGVALPGVLVPLAGPPQARPPAAGAGAPPAPGSGRTKTYTIQVGDFSFSPGTVHARVGDTINWVNRGATPHTATAKDGVFDVHLAPGQQSSYVLRAEGSISYVCTYHPQMVGTILVSAALPGVAVPPAPGRTDGKKQAGAAAPAGKAQTYEIQVKDMSYAPAMQTARVGDTISWVNVGSLPHTVTASDHSFDAELSPGQRFNVVLRKEGSVDYACSYHAGMTGMLMVEPALAGVVLPPPGSTQSGTSVAKFSQLSMTGLATGWLLLLALLAILQLRARVAPRASTASPLVGVGTPDPS